MSGSENRYDWTSYYAEVYERERRHNTGLAGQIADAERKQADCQDNLNRIYASPFWRMSAPARRLYSWLRAGRRTVLPALPSGLQNGDTARRYEEELQKQADPYGQWIQMCENKKTHDIILEGVTEYESREPREEGPIRVQDFQEMDIPDTDIVLLAYGDGLLAENICPKIKSYFDKHPYCLVAYADEDFYWEDPAHRMEPWFKPDYSPDTLLALQYWGHLVAVRRKMLSGLDCQRKGMTDLAVSFYELCLRLEEAVWKHCDEDVFRMREAVGHMEAVLYHRQYLPPEGELSEDASREEAFCRVRACLAKELEAGRFTEGAGREFLAVKEEACRRRGIFAELRHGQDPELYHMVYDTAVPGRVRCLRSGGENGIMPPHYMISVVIPSKDNPEALEKCLKSFRDRTAYRYYEWIVVDNGSNAENRLKLEELRKNYGFTYLYEPMPFNFSKMCNLGVRKARGECVLLLNDDIEIIEAEWLERMAGQALQPHTGAVGAKLWYAGTERIQHTGITNMRIGPSHKLVTFPDDRDYYYGRNRLVYDVIGVTAACLMVARKKYEEVGGMDETMAVAYNDVDFCFKLTETGYYNVQRNDVVLYHHESLSRGPDEQDAGKWERLLAEKEALYAKHPGMVGRDPFYHRDLIDNTSDYGCGYKFAYGDPLYTVSVEGLSKEAMRRMASKAVKSALRLTVDRAEIQHKIHREEPDILWVMGWCYVPGADNALFDRRVMLRRADGAGYLAVPVDWHRVDVEAILPEEKNVGLAGFVLRVRREDMEPGEYQIGMLCHVPADQSGKWTAAAWSDSSVCL